MMAWLEFCAAFAVFFLSHSLPVRPAVRSWLQARLGQGGFTLGYSVLSLAVLAWLIEAAGRAPYLPLWGWAAWHALVPLAVMLAVCLILSFSLARPNPFSFGGTQNDRFDPSQPGIVRFTRHPFLLALALWATAHIVPNGDLAHVILFGSFAGFAVLGGRLIDRRKQREMGGNWHDFRNSVAGAPVFSHSISTGGVLRLLAGLALYAMLLWAHPYLFGVSPLP